MRHLKKDLQKCIEHFVCYVFNDISARTGKITPFLDKENKIIPASTEIETTFREVMVEDYGALMQRYAVCLQPLFKYIKHELPELKEHLAPMEILYQTILDKGNFKNGCNCLGCRKFAPKCFEKGGSVEVPLGNDSKKVVKEDKKEK